MARKGYSKRSRREDAAYLEGAFDALVGSGAVFVPYVGFVVGLVGKDGQFPVEVTNVQRPEQPPRSYGPKPRLTEKR